MQDMTSAGNVSLWAILKDVDNPEASSQGEKIGGGQGIRPSHERHTVLSSCAEEI